MSSTTVIGRVIDEPQPDRRARQATARPEPAVLRDQRFRLVQLVLFAAGALLLPAGLIVIGLGWYGAAHTPYVYNQLSYLLSGGLFGLGLTFTGGFLYFGAWLAKVATDQRDSARQLSAALMVIADLVAATQAQSAGSPQPDRSAELVLAGAGSTVHRRDCQLVAERVDLRPFNAYEADTTTCRVCHPALI